MAGTFFDIDNALKIAYPSKSISPMVNQETPFRAQLKKNIPAGGRVSEAIVKFGANLYPPSTANVIGEGANLITPGDRTQDQFTLKPTIFQNGFEIGWMTRAAGNSNKSAFNGGELRRRVEETLEDLAKFIEQTYVAGDGTGKRAEVEDGTAANTLVMARPWGTRLLRVNQYISARTTPGGATVSNSLDYQQITAINHSTRTVTYGGTDRATVTAGADVSVVPYASQGTSGMTITSDASTAEGLTPNGLRGLVDDGTYMRYIHGLDRTATGYNRLNANVKSNGGSLRNLTEQILINACHEARQQTGKRVTDIWTNTGQVEKYIQFVAPDRRYTVSGKGTQGMGTGYTEDLLVHYAPGVAAKIHVSMDILPREIFLLNWDTFFHYLAQDVDWWDDPMLKPTPVSGGWKATYQAHLGSIENIGCDMPIANVVIRDLKDPLAGDA
jgi:hypothetical protein